MWPQFAQTRALDGQHLRFSYDNGGHSSLSRLNALLLHMGKVAHGYLFVYYGFLFCLIDGRPFLSVVQNACRLPTRIGNVNGAKNMLRECRRGNTSRSPGVGSIR